MLSEYSWHTGTSLLLVAHMAVPIVLWHQRASFCFLRATCDVEAKLWVSPVCLMMSWSSVVAWTRQTKAS